MVLGRRPEKKGAGRVWLGGRRRKQGFGILFGRASGGRTWRAFSYFIFISHGIVNEEKDARRMRLYVVKRTARLPWWERLYGVDLVLQRC